jgi:RNA-binding protein
LIFSSEALSMSAKPVKNPKDLNGAQRRALRALGHHLKPVVQIGLRGVTPSLVAATTDALMHHEIIKISMGSEAPVDRKLAPAELADATGAHVAGVVGRTAILYRRRHDDPVVKLPGVFEEAPRPVGPSARERAAAKARATTIKVSQANEPADNPLKPSRPGPGLLAAQRAAAAALTTRGAADATGTGEFEDDDDFDDEDDFDDDEDLDGDDEQ